MVNKAIFYIRLSYFYVVLTIFRKYSLLQPYFLFDFYDILLFDKVHLQLKFDIE